MGFEKEPSQLRSKGVHVSVENYVQIENNFSLDCLLEKEPIYDVKIINCLEKLSGDTKLSYIGIMVYTAVLVNWLLNLGLKNMIMMRDKNANYI